MKMHYCTARVNLSGQGFHIVQFEPSDAISWPEAQVLMALHGDENVMDVRPCFVSEISNAHEEKRRLFAKYGKVVEAVFPGRSFRMEVLMPGEADDQQRIDGDGVVIAQVPGDDDDDDEDENVAGDPPTNAVMKPGRHRPPPAQPAPLEG
jgi:uncharacterized protein YneR